MLADPGSRSERGAGIVHRHMSIVKQAGFVPMERSPENCIRSVVFSPALGTVHMMDFSPSSLHFVAILPLRVLFLPSFFFSFLCLLFIFAGIANILLVHF